MRRLSVRALRDAGGFRHGIVPPVEVVPTTFADLDGIANAAVAGDARGERDTVAGGIARDPDDAIACALGEALERYAAAAAQLPLRTAVELGTAEILGARAFSLFTPEQRRQPGFPFPIADAAEALYAPVHSLLDNREVWVPHELVSLGSRRGAAQVPSTSTGLAAHPDRWRALLSAVEELLERDAFTSFWLSSLGGRERVLSEQWTAPITSRGGAIECFELTQIWNPHPVIVVCGQLPLRGTKRYALGASCRGDHAGALEKAWLELLQGTIFAGWFAAEHPDLRLETGASVRDFPEHGVYYTLHPEAWDEVPMRRARHDRRPLPDERNHASAREQLESLVRALDRAGVRLFYRDLTTPDVADLGLTVVRALSPDLSLLHADEQLPFLGGRTRDVRWRWPDVLDATESSPNPYPHPLG
jgi:ribosomal protein S12 methylthiotransferase accessory factor